MSRVCSFARGVLLVSTLASSACGDLPPSWRNAHSCATPRPSIDEQGSVEDEKRFLRSWIDEIYLWYTEVPNPPMSDYATAVDYFAVLKTPLVTPSGKPKDAYHYAIPTNEWLDYIQAGVDIGYGARWAVRTDQPPRTLLVAYVEDGSLAAAAGLSRGTRVVNIDDVDVETGTDIDTLNAGLVPKTVGESHRFVVIEPGSETPRELELVSAEVKTNPVPNVDIIQTPTGPVGYLLFNEHVESAEGPLVDAIATLRDARITDLVLDLRYNGGGRLVLANELAVMIAGAERTYGEIFYSRVHNGKSASGGKLETFAAETSEGRALQSLSLPRLFVLTTKATCSASEALLNGLRGINYEVVQIGETTCGKPYGFAPRDNCSMTYFAIQFQTVNAKGFGDYTDGFTPSVNLVGCRVADDFDHALGDPTEAMLASALAYRDGKSCPIGPSPRRIEEGQVPSLKTTRYESFAR